MFDPIELGLESVIFKNTVARGIDGFWQFLLE